MDGFLFYRSYYEALKKLPADQRDQIIMAICQYMFDDSVPELDIVEQVIFDLVRPSLDKSKARSIAGQSKQQFANKDQTEPHKEQVGTKENKPNQAENKRKQTGSSEEQIKDKGLRIKDERIKDERIKDEGLKAKEKPLPVLPLERIDEAKDDQRVQCAENVVMTNAEYRKLLNTYGPADTKRLIEILDNYKGSSGKKYKSDYRAILSWCVDRLDKDRRSSNSQEGSGKASGWTDIQSHDEWDYDELERISRTQLYGGDP